VALAQRFEYPSLVLAEKRALPRRAPQAGAYAAGMPTLKIFVLGTWLLFWVYWLISATSAKEGTRPGRARVPGLLILTLGFVLLRIFKAGSLAVHSPVLWAVGVVLFLSGLGLAVWARVYLGRNWGMPMTQKHDPELVTSGPYRFVRHPIYSGILLALLGTSFAIAIYWLIAVVVMGAYFIHSASVEEKIMTASFPTAYQSYRAKTKMLIPFVL
jgi:protein-S-isoprenylcysteine O-methyltransferase Ste14